MTDEQLKIWVKNRKAIIQKNLELNFQLVHLERKVSDLRTKIYQNKDQLHKMDLELLRGEE